MAQLDNDECDLLCQIEKKTLTFPQFHQDSYYAILLRLFPKIFTRNLENELPQDTYDFFRKLKEAGFEKLVEIAKSVNLSDHLKSEFVKLQYQEPFNGSAHQLDELIRRLDDNRKLAELPDQAFQVLMKHIGQKLQLKDEQITLVSQMERNYDSNLGDKANALYSLLKQKGDLQHFPQKTRQLLQIRHNQANVGEMQKYYDSIKDVSFAPDITRELTYYEDLLIKIEGGGAPSEADLPLLDKLHDALKATGRLDAMPNRAQAFLENYQTQQEIKKKLPSNTNITELFKRLDNNQEFKPMEVAYFFFYLQKNDITLPPPEQAKFAKFLTQYPELAKITKQQTELLDPKALKLINQVIQQIIEEQRPGYHDGQKILVPSLNASISRTSNFMEIRFKEKELLDNFTKKDLTDFIKNPQNIDKKEFFRNHEGVDFSGLGNKKNGDIRYVSGFTKAAKIAKILEVKNSWTNGRATKDISIVEYHPDHGVLVTIFRHTQLGTIVNALRSGQDLKHTQLIGTYKIANSDKNEHAHIERRSSNVNSVSKFTAQQLESKLNALTVDTNNAQAIQEIQTKTQLVQPTIQGNDYHTIALFTPGSQLNSEFLRQVERDWLQNAVHSIEVQKIKTVNDLKPFIKTLNDGAFKDHLLLEYIVKILTRVKILLAQVGENNAELERTMQKAQHTAIDLREKYVPKQIKIIT